MSNKDKITSALRRAEELNGWSESSKLAVLIDFLEDHCGTFLAEEAARYVEDVARKEIVPAKSPGRFQLRERTPRELVVNLLRRLAPIAASRYVVLSTLGDQELGSLLICLRHLEGEISTLNTRLRQPWSR